MPNFCINGNFANLSRYLNGTLIDNLVYSYISSGNRLSGVHDNSNNALGYDDNNGNYTYDANGNTTYDPGKGVNIGYNEMNLPEQVQFGANDNIRYTYDAAGRKLIKVVDGTIAANNTRLDYCGNFVYEDNQLKAIFTSEGRIVKDGATYKFEYNMTDHLGNVRAAFIGQSSGTPLVTQRSSYFPFGMVAEQTDSYSTGILKNNYLYNGKELQDDEVAGVKLDWYDYGARMYDAELGRFLTVDPMAFVAPDWSPYRAFYCNPILYVDPTGMLESTHIDKDGNVITVIDDGDNSVYQHGDNADGGKPTEYMIKKRQENYKSTAANGKKVGETEHWDEFVSPETGKPMTNYKLQLGKSFGPIVKNMNEKAQNMDLREIAAESGPNGDFDIKIPYKNVGGLLDGKYATSRSAGNYLAGYNSQGGTYFGVGISFETFQKLAGALHVKGSLTNKEKAAIVLFGKSYGDPPTYGEVMYQYRMSKAGWDKAKLNNK